MPGYAMRTDALIRGMLFLSSTSE